MSVLKAVYLWSPSKCRLCLCVSDPRNYSPTKDFTHIECSCCRDELVFRDFEFVDIHSTKGQAFVLRKHALVQRFPVKMSSRANGSFNRCSWLPLWKSKDTTPLFFLLFFLFFFGPKGNLGQISNYLYTRLMIVLGSLSTSLCHNESRHMGFYAHGRAFASICCHQFVIHNLPSWSNIWHIQRKACFQMSPSFPYTHVPRFFPLHRTDIHLVGPRNTSFSFMTVMYLAYRLLPARSTTPPITRIPTSPSPSSQDIRSHHPACMRV